VTDASETAASSRHHRFDAVLLLILIVAFVSRLVLASTQSLVYDEYNTTIPLAERIHFSGNHRYLPLRAINHPALPAYVVKASRALLDTTEPIGYRGLHVIGGLGIVLLAYLMTHQWYGRTAARWAAALMAFNEYSLDVGTRATAHVPFLFCVTAAVYAFSRFLHERRLLFLYSAAVALGVVLLAGVAAATVRHAPNDRARPYFLLLFWGVFGFFTLIRKGTPDGLDSVSWIWVDTTMIPAIVLTAAMLAGSIGRVRAGLWTFAAFSLVISVARVFA
jgi:hypothetical protein